MKIAMPAQNFRKFGRCLYSYQKPNRFFFTKKIDKCTYQEREKDPETGKEAFQLRLWDARIGRCLTTDPYGQFSSPYLGLGNNPMNGVDPDGGLFLVDDWLIGGFKGLFNGEGVLKSANRHFNNSAKIWGGLFTSDKNKSTIGQIGEVVSRNTYQLPQTVVGFLSSHLTNMFDRGENVGYAAGATVLSVGKSSDTPYGYWGVTLGTYILGSTGDIVADRNNSLFRHECGHYIQSQKLGWAYFPVIGIPSALNEMGVFGGEEIDGFYTETWADKLSDEYFGNPNSTTSIEFQLIVKCLKLIFQLFVHYHLKLENQELKKICT